MKLKKTFFSIFMRIAIIGTFLVSLCAILFSLSLNHVVALSYTVSTEAQLQEALASSVYDEIILSNSITLSNGTTIDGDLDGNGIKKTIRAEVTGTTSQGVVNEDASNYTLFYVSKNATVTIKNCNIKGGGITAIVNGAASNSTNNNSTLYIDNCSISNSGSTTSPGGGIRNTVASKVVLTNSSISRNIANYGAGFQNQQGTFIVDNCSISENRSFQYGGGGGENTGNDNKGGADAYMYIVNSTIANNTSQEIGGGINNCKNGYLYVINSVIAGNATTNPQYSGGGIGNNNSTLKCTNSILMDNVYLSATGGTTEQDVYEYSSGQLSLDGCVYGSVTGSTQNLVNEVEVDSTCYQASSSDSVFASSKTGSIIDEDGHQGTNTYNQVVLVEDENGVTYAPLSSDSLANMANNPSFSTVKVEFDYSDLNNIVLKTKDECSNETEAPTVCGAGKQLESNERILTLTLFVNEDFDLTGGTVYGDSYIVSENGDDTVTLKATPVKGKENKSVLWAQANVSNETLTYLSSDNAYEINLSDSNLLNSCWDETKNSYNLIIQPITLNLSAEASDKAVKLNYSIDYSDTFCKYYSLTNSITSYDIYYSVVNDFESSSKQFFGNVTGQSVTITGLTNETTYYFYVVARIGSASFNGTIVGCVEGTPIESGAKTYVLVDALESGKEYLIVGRNTAGTGYALTNNNTNRATTTAVTVTTLDSTPIINVEATDSMLWTVTGSGTSYRISNGNRYIYLSSNTNITYTTSRNLTVTPTSIKYGNYSLQLTTATPTRYNGTRNVYFYEVKHKQDAPTTIEGSIQQRIGEDSGVITGVTNKMEYSTDGLSWNSISSTTLENMPVGKYFFRYKETNLAYASAAVTVEVLEKKLEQINIHTNPKLSYTAKDSLDLSSLVVTLVYNDGSTTNVSYADFASTDSSVYQRKNGTIQTSIENGTILECSNNDSRITISLDGLETVTAKMTISHHLVHVERKEATCTENGNEEYYICDSCGLMYSDSEGLNRIYVIPTIYATSHVWGSQVEENRVEPTCTEAGHYDLVIYCERCHEELQRQTVTLSPLGHTWGPQVIENRVEPTCDIDGHYDLVIYCSVCGEELQRQTVTIEKLGHDYKNPVWVWDGFTAKYVYTCERDNDHKLELDADITSEITLAPTCLATGKKVYTATVEYQGNTYTDTKEEILPALGHNYDYNNPVWTWAEYSSATVTFTCLNDTDHKDTYTATITGEVTKAPTCTTTGVRTYTATVSVSGKTYTDTKTEVLPALGHTEAEAVVENRVEATCEVAGHYDLVIYCSVCGEELSRETIEIPALGHTEAEAVVENRIDATCEMAGHYDLVVYCSVCGEEISRETIEIPALGHNFDYNNPVWTWNEYSSATVIFTCLNDEGHKDTYSAIITPEVTKAATCLISGVKTYTATVSVNGKTYTDTKTEVLPALGHTEAEAVVENKVDATCETAGHYDLVVYCQVCGEELSRETITVEALGHDYDYSNPVWSWNEYSSATVTFTCLNDIDHKDTYNAVIESEITQNPTCTVAGTKIYTATVIVNGNTYTSTKEETLNVLGHSEAETVVENRIEPTCETPGSYDLVVYCSVCGEELSRETIIIPSLGHEYGKLIPEVLATCTTTGIKAHYHCLECGKYFDQDKNEVTYEELIIEALGHTEANAVEENRVEPTCTEAGHYDLVVYCQVCGEELSRETIEIPALGHDYDLNNPVWIWNEYSSATVTFTCLNDENHKDIHTAEITSEVTQAPTCEETGIRRYTAIVTLDGKTYTNTKTEVLPALGHTEAEAVVENKVDATCDVDGSYDLVVYCQVCGKELSRNTYIIPAFGHDYDYSDPEWTWDGYLSATVVFTCSHDEDHKISYNAIISIDSEVLPTCTLDGVRKLIATITVNGSIYTNTKIEVLPALGHTEAEAVVENRIEPTCETSGSYDLVVYCSVCGLELSRETIEIEALGHNYDTHLWVWNGYDEATITFYCAHDNNHQVSYNATITSEITLAPTDSTAGEKVYTATVVVDGITYTTTKIEVLTKLHHAIITVHAKEATCDEDGNITYYYCPDCNIYYSDANLSVEINYEDTIIPALGHIYSDYIDEVLPTCTTNGMKAHYHCQRCNKYFDEDKNEVSYESLVIEALGHTLLPAVKENEVLPTCEEDGHYDLVVYCSVCGEVVSRETIVIPALGHNYSDGVWYWNEYSSATLTYTCLNDSNHKLVYDATITSVVTIEPTDNTAGEKVYTATVVVDGITYTSQKIEELPKLHHAIITVYEKAATCEEDGNITYYYCPDCHIYYSDANLSNEITLEETIIHALGHNPSEAVVENKVEATCETEGHYDLVVYCSRCGLELSRETIIIPALGHEYGELIAEVLPTCTTTGIKAHYHCVECGKYFDQDKNEVTYEELIIEALGHINAEAVIENRVEPTCTEAGHYDSVIYCLICGEELSRETIIIPALGHTEGTPVEENRVEATCETVGHYDLVVYCQVCGEEISRETIVIPALGHDFDYDNPVWTWQGYESAQITFTCKHDSTHKSIHNATITSKTTIEPTDNTSGLKVYTAVVEVLGITYKNQKQEELPKLHHAIITVYEKAATCEEDGNITYYYCPDCNIYYSDATLSNEITYEATIIPALGHNPSEAVVENRIEATCETTGSYDLVIYCSRCGEELSRETILIPALGHEYGELIPEVPATCITTGIKAHYHCLECGKYFDSNKNEVTYEELIIEALGHTNAEAVIENRVEPTCTEAGHYDSVIYCQVCGEELSRETILIPALGHTPLEAVVENRVEATCEVAGHYDLVVYCQVCGEGISRETIIIPALGHDFDYSNPVWTWKDYESAQITFTCLNDTNHKDTYNATIISEVTLAPTDTTTGTKEYTATVTVNGLTYTDTKVEELPVTAHTIEVVYAKSPTCKEDGNILYYYCPECNKYYSDTNLSNEIILEETIIHALGHNPSEAVVENKIEATCETAGSYDLVIYCSRCGEELSRETIIIPALGHEFGELIAEVPATCTTTGIKAHYHCLECGKYFDSNKNEVTYEELIIEALGHTEANAVVENRVEATCTEAGHYDLVVYCQVCGEELSRETIEIEALGHTPLEAKEENRVESTCEVAGHYDLVVYCSVCGEIISKETIEIEALGHEYDLDNPVWTWISYQSVTITFTCLHDANHKDVHHTNISSEITIAPTDSASGMKKYTASITIYGHDYLDVKYEELPKNHHAITTVYAKDATCKDNGNILYYYCAECDKYYSDANLSNEITLEETIIFALGHNPSEAVVENKVEATCETEGHYDLVVYCSRCGEELSRETILIPALGHEYGELIPEVLPTCTTTGIKAHYHCLECGKYFDQDKNEVTYEELIIEALGHAEATAVEENRVEPTCTEAGHYDLVVYCQVCGEELSRETITIPTLGHTEGTPVEENRVEATCETAGHYDLVVYCSVCGEELSRETIEIEALGHDYDYSNPVWTWISYQVAKVTFTCKHNLEHTITYDVEITSLVTVLPTDSQSGLKVYTAKVTLGNETFTSEKIEELPKNHHNITVVYAKDATCDEDGNILYYYCAECDKYYLDGALKNEITQAETIIPKFGHTYGELIAMVEPTCSNDGMKAHYHCQVCGKYFDSNKNEVTYESLIIEALGHMPLEAVVENKVEATCEASGSYDLVVYCSRCGDVLSRETITIPALGHDYQNPVWHWNGFDFATLTFTCINDANHEDVYNASISSEITVMPTDSQSGLRVYTALVYAYGNTYTDTKEEALPKNHHTIVTIDGVEATCDTDGHITYYYCPDCNLYYSDAALSNIITLDDITIKAYGHKPGTPVVENSVEATCTTSGSYDLVIYCERCHHELSRETVIVDTLGHDYIFVDEVLPTCLETGVMAHYICNRCNKYFDINKNEVTYESLITNALGHEEASKVVENVIEATCETSGSYDLVVYCSHCHIELSRERFVTNPLEHDYDYHHESWEWLSVSDAIISFSCLHDASHKISYHANITSNVILAPTCLEDGILRYTATITINGVNYESIKDVAIAKTGHDYDYSYPVWNWLNYEQAKVSFTCLNDNHHQDIYDSIISSMITLEPTCEAIGYKEYTATVIVNGYTYTNKVIEELAALGHDYQFVDKLLPLCEETGLDSHYHCDRCDKYFDSNKNEVTYQSLVIEALGHSNSDKVMENNILPTCLEFGSYDLVTYCMHCGIELNRETINVNPLGHDYSLVDTLEPTGDTKGFMEHYYCNRCHKYFDLDKNEVSYDSLVIPELGYTYTYIVRDKVFESYHGYKGDTLIIPKYPQTYEENEILYRFIGFDKEIPNELTEDITFVALYKMERIYLKEVVIDLPNELMIDSSYRVEVRKLEDSEEFKGYISRYFSDYDLTQAYKIVVIKGEEEIDLADYNLTIKMKKKYLTELEDDSKLFVLNSNNEIEELNYTIDGQYIVFNTSAMSNFAFANSNSTVLYLVLIVQSLSLGMLVLILVIKKFVKR